ncbi:unnamed protein product [Orchesella dallaii]|uniref:MACPF domain-containing protein n=1 Tax=Orchesella dallaii TaxID=48710 RepID=A0ABP1SA66_9HEXA
MPSLPPQTSYSNLFLLQIHEQSVVLIFFLLSAFVTNRTASENIISCATLQSQERGLQLQNLTIGDGSVIGNIPDEYANATRSWNASGFWTVAPGCELTACENVYLIDSCSQFGGNVTSPITSNQWQSARCRCSKICTCSEVDFQHSVCARAYLQANGCNVCDAPYTELDGANPTFPEVWSNKIGSFLLRPGCTIKVYEEEDFEGEPTTVDQSLVENWNGSIRSYECHCDEYLPDENWISLPSPSPSSFIDLPQIEIPNTLDEVVSLLRQHNYNHSGLLAAFSSLTQGRSPKNAYILLIGSTGAGKSSAINNLLNNPNVTLAGDLESTTSEILEFSIPIPLDELGVSNSQLRIIDTPGLGDTRGLQHDAIFLATLDEYLGQHSELKRRIPNLVLVFHHFTDNRFDGEGAKFVSMIQGLDSLRTRITDEKYSNVLFVFSHFCSETSTKVLRNPSGRLMKFKEVIEEYTLFPKPILTSVIENQGKENELLVASGNYELPNKEYFPLNLLDKFDTITMKGQDKMGRAIINQALRKRHEHLNVNQTQFEMVNGNHPKVAKYLSKLSSSVKKFESSEVSQQLTNAYDNMPALLKTQFPSSLEYLLSYMKKRNIRSKSDLAQTTVGIVEFLEKIIEKNEAVWYLLEKGLKLLAPNYPASLVIGHSFNLIKYTVLPVSPFKLDSWKMSEVGYKLPDVLKCRKQSRNLNSLEIFDRMEQFIRYKLANDGGIYAGLVGNINTFTGLQGQINKQGVFVNETGCTLNNTCSFVAYKNFELFQTYLDFKKENVTLSPVFIQRVSNLTPLNESNYESVRLWNDFFNEFGTHVVKSGWGGGRIGIKVEIPSSIQVATLKEKLFKVVEYVEDLSILISGKKIDPKEILPVGVNYSLVFYGGNQIYHTSDLSALSLEDAKELMDNWKVSLKYNPVMNPIEFVPIYEVAQSLGLRKVEYIKEASSRLLNSTLVYKPPPPKPTQDPNLALATIARERRQNERKLGVERRRMETQRLRLEMQQEENRKQAEFLKAAEELTNRIQLYRIEMRGEKERAQMCRTYQTC